MASQKVVNLLKFVEGINAPSEDLLFMCGINKLNSTTKGIGVPRNCGTIACINCPFFDSNSPAIQYLNLATNN